MSTDHSRTSPQTPPRASAQTPAQAPPPQRPYPDPDHDPRAAPWTYEFHFPRDPRAPGVVRAALRAVLTAHCLTELLDRATVLTSELTTNSIQHTKGPASVRLHWLSPVLRVSVWDMSPDLPPLVPPPPVSPHADGGRGLVILDTVADRWGGCAIGEEPYGPGGKTMWFELTRNQAPPPVPAA
ncbi:ATP-binding protein [Streptomyces sp. LNU-CPARS28]|uniref:ATP-binding protein n=1 Tax=Streptomyces sp. LNU-CPARS28 TaxID=3137371 RepID=UPI0031375783